MSDALALHKVENPAVFKSYLLCHFASGAGNWTLILKQQHNI